MLPPAAHQVLTETKPNLLSCLTETFSVSSSPGREKGSETMICGSGKCPELPFPGISVAHEVKVSASDKEEFVQLTYLVSA